MRLKKLSNVFILLFLLSTTLYAEYSNWDVIEALAKNDLPRFEKIIKDNISAISMPERRLIMNFAIIYSYGENTLQALEILEKYNIQPGSFDLYTAINRNQPDTLIQLMLYNGVEPNGEILLLAMEKQRFDLAKRFIETGVDVNYQYPLTRSYADGMTPLLYAAKWNSFELVKMLAEAGAKINAQAKDGNTPLSLAQTNENSQIYNYLMERGASANIFIPPASGAGISSFFENQAIDFQRGTYQMSGSNVYIKFTGSSDSGAINYISNGKTYSGIYKTGNNIMTLTIEGRAFVYKIDSNTSFSGNGEIWIRSGN